MDILILNWKDIKNPDVGGAEVILYELSKRLNRKGHSVTWFCRTFPGSRAEEIIDGIRFVRRGNRFSVYMAAYRYYISLATKPDRVIDCINTICWQTPWYVPGTQRIAYVNQLAREVLHYELPPVLSQIAFALEPVEYVPYKQTRFVCYAESVRKDLATVGIPRGNVSTFPIGIDHDRYTPGKKSATPFFVFVARLTSMKRPELCIAAMSIVVRNYPDARLAIVGYGPLEQSLERRIREASLDRNVFIVNKNHLFFDKNPKDQKVALMRQAWALLLPSVKEGWGLVVTEAAACGTPSIVTKVTGLVDSVTDEQTGIVLSPDPTAGELAEAMTRLIDDKKLLQVFSQNAMKRARQFTWDRSVAEFETIITR